MKYKLVRERDGLEKYSGIITWIEWKEDGTFKQAHKEPAIGLSLVMDASGLTYTWLTTTIKKIVQMSENYIKFETENSTYELFINKL